MDCFLLGHLKVNCSFSDWLQWNLNQNMKNLFQNFIGGGQKCIIKCHLQMEVSRHHYNSWWRHYMEPFFALLAHKEVNFTGTFLMVNPWYAMSIVASQIRNQRKHQSSVFQVLCKVHWSPVDSTPIGPVMWNKAFRERRHPSASRSVNE